MKARQVEKARYRLPMAAVAFTVLSSIGISALVAQVVSSRHHSTPNSTSTDGGRGDIVVRLERLEDRLSEASSESEAAPRVREEARPQRSIGGQTGGDVHERLARLEEIEQRRQQAEERQRAASEARAEQRRAQLEQATARAAEVMLDPTVDDQVKVDWWGQIRMNAEDSWTDEIVTEVVRIGSTSTDPILRANVWRQAHAGRTHPSLLQPLLFALANDTEPSAREEAAETLDLYLDQPGVMEALQMAAQYDANPGVQQQATISLGGPQGGF